MKASARPADPLPATATAKRRRTKKNQLPLRLPVYATGSGSRTRAGRQVVTIRAHPVDPQQFQCFDAHRFLDVDQIPRDHFVQLNPICFTDLSFPRASRIPVQVFLDNIRRGPGDQLVIRPGAAAAYPELRFAADRRRRAFTTIQPSCMSSAQPAAVTNAMRRGRVGRCRKATKTTVSTKPTTSTHAAAAADAAMAAASASHPRARKRKRKQNRAPGAVPGRADTAPAPKVAAVRRDSATASATVAAAAAPRPPAAKVTAAAGSVKTASTPAPATTHSQTLDKTQPIAKATQVAAAAARFECMICEDEFAEAERATGLCRAADHAVCKSCMVQSFEATGRVPACPDPLCTTKAIPTVAKMKELFAGRPDLHGDLQRSIAIFRNVQLAPCPQTGADGVVSLDGDFVQFHAKCPAQFRCNTCLRPLAPNSDQSAPLELCGCRRLAVKMPASLNPFFRHVGDASTPQAFGIARNFQITEDHMRRFFNFIIRECRDAVPCVCPGCSTKLHKTSMCNEMTCPKCGTHVCNFCGRAEKCRAMLDHFGVVECPRFDAFASLSWRGRAVHMRCPCGPKCQNDKHDCSDPAHRGWRKLLTYNRRSNWIDSFIRALDPAKQVVARQMLRDEFLPAVGSFSEPYVATDGRAHVQATAAV